MGNDEQFAYFKRRMLKRNEERFGREILEKYGAQTVAASNEKFLRLSRGTTRRNGATDGGI
jgi:hypothetical protein